MRTTATRRDLALLTAAALALLVGTAALTWSRADDASSWDVPLYQSFGDQMADGEVPYRDFRVEYPPGSLPVFLLPSLAAADGEPVYEPELNDAARGYARGFAALMTALLAATVALTAMSLAALRASVGHAPALALVGATPLLLGELALTRFDALLVALSAACVAALLHGRSRLAALALGLAVAAKSTRCCFLPLAAIYSTGASAPRGRASPESRWQSSRRSSCRSSRSRPPRRGSRSARSLRAACKSSLSGNLVVALSVAADHVGLGTLGVGVDEGGTGEVRSRRDGGARPGRRRSEASRSS